MGKFDGIAILTDLDCTFLSDGTKTVRRNVEAIEYFKKEGGLFTLSTGRMHFNLDAIVTDVDTLVNAPAIMCNGTYFYDFSEKKVFCERFMDAELAYKTVQFVHNLGGDTVIRGCNRQGYVVDTLDKRGEKLLISYGITAIVSAPYKDWNTENYYKIVFEDGAEALVELEKTLEAQFPNVFEYNRSRSTLLELQMKGVNKSTLFKDFRDYYRREGRELVLYACGDNENDIEMLRVADVAVCPSNAIEPVKALCDKCLCSNNEGVIADLIENL